MSTHVEESAGAPASEPAVRLTSAEAIPLAYALTARVAAENDVPLLAIKGVVLAHHELRAPRVSADVDVLVAPDRAERFAAAMQELGWRRPPEANAPRLRRQHAINLVNEHWPIGIDLHTYFPGFLAPDGEVFAELWRRRVPLEQASHQLWVTDLSASAAVAALHHLRERELAANQAAFSTLVAKATARMSAEDRDDLVALATATGSTRSLTPFLDELGITPGPEHPSEAGSWQEWLDASTADRSTVWWTGWSSTPWSRRPLFVWRAFQPDEERLRHLYFHDTASPLWRLRLRRAQYVLRRLPDVLRRRDR